MTITTGLVDTYSTPTLSRLMATHHDDLDQFMEAYRVFPDTRRPGALKVVLARATVGMHIEFLGARRSRDPAST